MKTDLRICLENCEENSKRSVILMIDKTKEISKLKCSLACTNNLLNKPLL